MKEILLGSVSASRSRNMAAIRSRDTQPELFVRRAVHAAGFRYSLKRRDLQGKPDLVFPRYGLTVFVHGCFWHGHICHEAKRPRTNLAYWTPKIEGNMTRDKKTAAKLRRSGWTVVTIRECRLSVGVERLLTLLRDLRRDRNSGDHVEFTSP